MRFPVSRITAVNRVMLVLRVILSSQEWECRSHGLHGADWVEVREAFRCFFDVYEECPGTDWLGIMENAVVEEIRSAGADLTATPATVDRILLSMAAHPNIELLD